MQIISGLVTIIYHKRCSCVRQVIGVGGGGGNAVNRMLASHLKGVELFVLNTDSQVDTL